jgi:hypothetical protein
MANKYWVGGSGTWDTTTTTHWSDTSGGAAGAVAPTASDSVFFNQAGSYSVTITTADCLDLTVSAGTVTFPSSTVALGVYGSFSIIAGTVWSTTGSITFRSTTTGKTVTTNGVTITASITFNGAGGGWALGGALTLGSTNTLTLTAGALNLNGFDISTGAFNGGPSQTRSIAFGSNNINLVHTTAGTTVLNMGASYSGFSWTGTGGFVSNASITRTYTVPGTLSGGTPVSLTLTGSGTAVQTFTTGGAFQTVNFGTTAFTLGTTSLSFYGSLTLSSGGTYTSLTVTMAGTGTLTTNNKPIATLTFNAPGGTVTLGSTTTLVSGGTTTLTAGALNLNGFNLDTGLFSSSNSNTRSIAFGSNFIYLTTTTAAAVNVAMVTVTGFTFSGTGGFSAGMSVTRTFSIGSTTNNGLAGAPNLFITSGASVPTITTNSWIGTLNFTGSTAAVTATSVINLQNLTLASGGIAHSFNATMRDTGTITSNGSSIGTLTINHSGTTTLVGNLSCIVSTSYTQTAGTIDFASYNLTCTGSATYTSGTLLNIGTISCTQFTVSGGTFNFTQGTITATTSFFVSSSGTFNCIGGTLTSLPAFTQTLGDVTLSSPITVTGTYNLTAGNLTLSGANLTCNIFSSSNSNTRSIAFGSNYIFLVTTTAATTNLSMANASGLSCTGTGGFSAIMSVTRTFTVGTTAAATTPPNLFITSGASAPTLTTGSIFGNVDFTGSTCSITAVTSVFFSGLVLASGGTYTALTATLNNSGTLNGNGKTIVALTINHFGTTTVAGNLTTSTTITFTQGTINLAGYTLTATTNFVSVGPTTRTITGTGIISVAGAWTVTDGAGFTGNSYTINMTNASSKTFAGGNGSYGTLVQAGAGALTISGSNAFADIQATTRPSTITFTAGTTQSLSNFTLSGTTGNLVTINSTTAGTQYTLTKSNGTVSVNYLSIQDSNVTGGAYWGTTTSTFVSNNTGWNLAPPSSINGQFMAFF